MCNRFGCGLMTLGEKPAERPMSLRQQAARSREGFDAACLFCQNHFGYRRELDELIEEFGDFWYPSLKPSN